MIDRNKHFLRLMDWSEEKVLETIEIASRLKAEVHAGKVSDRLHGQNIAMFFEKPSLRTITTFQVGMNQLGGHAVLLAPDSIGLGKRESVKDVARCLSRWVNAILCWGPKKSVTPSSSTGFRHTVPRFLHGTAIRTEPQNAPSVLSFRTGPWATGD